MKKQLLKFTFIVFIALGFSTQSFSQFTSDSKIISAGITGGLYAKYYHSIHDYDRSIVAPMFIQFEKGFSEGSPFAEYSSFFTAGAFLGVGQEYLSRDFTSPELIEYEVYRSYLNLSGGIVLSGHYTTLLEEIDIILDPEVFDLYVSLKAGLTMQLYKSNFDQSPMDNEVIAGLFEKKDRETFLYVSPTLGARYYFTPQIGAMIEFGYFNTGSYTIGLSYKL